MLKFIDVELIMISNDTDRNVSLLKGTNIVLYVCVDISIILKLFIGFCMKMEVCP